MTVTTSSDADRLALLIRGLREAPGIVRYTDVFPRLCEKHLRFLGDAARIPRVEVAELLTSAGRSEPPDLGTVVQEYRERGELPALRMVADVDTVARATVEWQREMERKLRDAEKQAALCDAEGVQCLVREGAEVCLTWTKRVNEVRNKIGGEYADSPASQNALVEECLAEMERTLGETKQSMKDRLAQAVAELGQKQAILEERDAAQAQEYAESSTKLIADNKLIPALRKLGMLESLLSGRVARSTNERNQRFPLPRRRNPLGRSPFHFEALTGAARLGATEVTRRGLEDYLPSETVLQEAKDPSGFLNQHAARRVPRWSGYWAVFRDWLGLDDPQARKDDRQRRRARRLKRPDMPNLEPKGENLPGHWIFLTTDPWQGAPYYEDINGRPRIVAIVRLAVADAVNRPLVIQRYVSQVLRDLLIQLPAETDDERRFRQDGLVIVMLPGEALSGRKHEQFRQQVQLEKTAPAGRVAYIDDLDLLRLLPVSADDRFRALLELALPRFPEALSQTYQYSDAVRSRMFFGRLDELTRLENGTTVVFSGRKMGKSSLLYHLRAQCTQETDKRAIMVGCAGIASGRSWIVLREITRELERFLAREVPGTMLPAMPHIAGLMEDPARALQEWKESFRDILAKAMQVLEAHHVRLLYVLLDEADNFVRAELEETSGERNKRAAVSWFLRELQTSTYPGRLRFIFAGYDQVGHIFRDPGLGHSAFANWGELLKLGQLDQSAAHDLVARPLTALGLIVSDDVVERILDYTSGHASLIQAFCRKLAERVREVQPDWPLNDVPVGFEDLQAVAEGQRSGDDQGYRELLEQTLGLNLDIARAYPLKLIFLALVSPTGLGAGRVLGWVPFTFEEALEQVRAAEGGPAADLPATLVMDTLDLLAQLGLLDVSEDSGRVFTFKARHYVNVLRTKNGFQAQLQQALDEWQQSGRRITQAEPRYVWTLPDSDLRAMRQGPRPAVVVGLPGSGRGYLAEMLAAPFAGGTLPHSLASDQEGFDDRFESFLADPPRRPLVVADPADCIVWPKVVDWLRRAEHTGLALRWVGGPKLAWDLAGDLETALLVDGPYGLGPLTPAELEPWAVRPLGGDTPPSAVSIPEPDRGILLTKIGGLLPALEMFREWLLNSDSGFPDTLRHQDAERFLSDLSQSPVKAGRIAERLAHQLPVELRTGIHHLFTVAHELGDEIYRRSDLTELAELAGPAESRDYFRGVKTDDLSRLLDAASWLGLLHNGGASGWIKVPHESVLGLLIRHARFVAS